MRLLPDSRSRPRRPLVAGGQGRTSREVQASARLAALAILALALLALLGGAAAPGGAR